LVPARWGAGGVGSSINLNRVLLAGDPKFKSPPSDPIWNHTAATYLSDLGFCIVVGIGYIVLCALLLRRGDTKPSKGRH
jgi:hypothetical protein